MNRPLSNKEFLTWTKMLRAEGWFAEGSMVARACLCHALYSGVNGKRDRVERAIAYLFS